MNDADKGASITNGCKSLLDLRRYVKFTARCCEIKERTQFLQYLLGTLECMEEAFWLRQGDYPPLLETKANPGHAFLETGARRWRLEPQICWTTDQVTLSARVTIRPPKFRSSESTFLFSLQAVHFDRISSNGKNSKQLVIAMYDTGVTPCVHRLKRGLC